MNVGLLSNGILKSGQVKKDILLDSFVILHEVMN